MPEAEPAADLLLASARIPAGLGGPEPSSTHRGSDPVDLLIRGGRIAAVVPAGAPLGDVDAGAERLELGGRWVVPGLWDEHVHMTQWAIARRRVDVADAASAAEAAQRMRAAAGGPGASAGELLVGQGFRDGLWPDAPTSAVLDAAVPHRPVVIVSGDLHACWLNSPALERFGLAGHPSGLLREDECFAVVPRLAEAPVATTDAWVAEAATAAAARGVVGVVDMEMPWSMAHWRRRMASGFDLLRVWASVYPGAIEEAVAAGIATGEAVGPLLHMGYAKVITDGSLNTRTAYCVDPYPGTADRGVLSVPTDALLVFLRRAAEAGIAPAVHAIGDEANRLALDALEALGVGRAVAPRIEHAQLLRRADLPRFAASGIVASIQPEHAMDDRDVAEHHWAGRTERGYLVADLLGAGARVVFGSDAPVAPLDPWVGIAAAVTRTRGDREPWHPEQAISPVEAIACSARTRLRTGAPADLAVLDADPHDPAALRTMPVAATLLAGRWTHRAID